ncbi:MAG TPA: PQQ-binding-like beta-propeller repeat protein [Gemmatimonadaceae bacterium]
MNRDRWPRRVALLIGIIAAVVVVRAAARFGQTWDEPAHLAAGMQWLVQGRYDYDPQHPPLARIAIAIGPRLEGATAHGQPTMWSEGNTILVNSPSYARTLALARLGVLPFFLLLLAIVWGWTRSLYGDRAATLGVLLVATTPQLLAHAGLATNDVPLTATLLAALWAFTLWLDEPSRTRTAVFAVAGAATIATKFSSLPYFAIAALFIVLARWTIGVRAGDGTRHRPRWAALGAYARPALAAAMIVGLLLWSVYRFHLRFAVGGRIPQPAPELLAGLRQLVKHDREGHASYLLGHVSSGGWWWYWWVAFAVKTPLAFLSLAALGVAFTLVRPMRRADWRSLAPLLAAAAVMIVAMLSRIDIGVRHILPLYPLLAIPAAGAVATLWSGEGTRPLARAVLGALVAWQTVQAVRAYPDYLSDFNAIAGHHPETILVDSNLDWGQDLDRLADTLHARQVHAVSLFYFGSAPVGSVDLADTVRLGGAAPATGWVAVSETYLQGVYSSCFTWLRAYQPVARIGRSIALYHLLPDTAPRLPPRTRATRSRAESYGPVLAGSPSRDMICRKPRVVLDGGAGAFLAPVAHRRDVSVATTSLDTTDVVGDAGAPAAAVTDAMLAGATNEGDDWLTNGRDYTNSRYSPLSQINTNNVRTLRLAWAHQVGTPVFGQESTPVESDGVLYYTSPLGVVMAVDARTGAELWRYDNKTPNVPTCCGAKNRGVAVYHDLVYVSTLDDHLIALDSRTGHLVWDVQTADPDSSYSMTAAPLAVDGKIVVGVAGSEFGIRGHVDAYDAQDGRLAWRFYTIPSPADGGWWGRWSPTTPDGDVLPRDLAQEKRDSARYAGAWRLGGGGVWNTPSYDPTLGLLYFGVGNPAPNMDGSVRPGDNLYTSSVVALDVHTGSLRWYYQEVPHDLWDYDATSPVLMLDVTVNGARVPAVAQAGKVGWIYVLDRRTGARIRRTAEFVPHLNTFAAPTTRGTLIMPGMGGGSNWTPLSYSPRTRLIYVAGIVEPIKFTLDPARFEVGVKWQGGYHVPVGSARGTFTAIDPATGQVQWQTRTARSMLGGASLVTAGDVVFYGEQAGAFHAADARTGALLWTTQLGGSPRAPAISYALDGRQYVSVAVSGTLFTFTLPE